MNRSSTRSRTFEAPSAEVLDAELGRVHAREFARLLLGASRLRARLQSHASVEARRLAAWRRAARRARDLAIVDGYELPGHLRRCLACEPERWSSIGELVKAAWDCSASEVRRREARVRCWIPGFPTRSRSSFETEVERW